MRAILILFLMLLGIQLNDALATPQTGTHTYILDSKHNRVLVINRHTNQETTIPVGIHPTEMAIHGQFGYVVSYGTYSDTQDGSGSISVINLDTNLVTQTIPVIKHLSNIIFANRLAYVYRKFGMGEPNNISVIDLQSNTVTNTITVTDQPKEITIHGNFGYVRMFDSIDVIDLTHNKVIKTIKTATIDSMVIQGNKGYLLFSHSIGVLDLTTNQLQPEDITYKNEEDNRSNFLDSSALPGETRLYIHKDLGYILAESNKLYVFDLKTQRLIDTLSFKDDIVRSAVRSNLLYLAIRDSKKLQVINLDTHSIEGSIKIKAKGNFNPVALSLHENLAFIGAECKYGKYVMDYLIDLDKEEVVCGYKVPDEYRKTDFTDTHIYQKARKVKLLYPTEKIIHILRSRGALREFVKMNPKAFQAGNVEKRDLPTDENEFDTLPPYVLAQHLFWDLATNKPLMDPVDILATLVTMKYPQRFLKHEAGQWLRPRLHTAFFQAVWAQNDKKAKTMLRYFIQLGDPVICRLATYKLSNITGENTPGFEDAEDTPSIAVSSQQVSQATNSDK